MAYSHSLGDPQRLKALCDKLFEKRSGLLTLWQTIAENFYPERAEFTTTRTVGAEFGSDLMTSYPVLARRDLGDSFATLMPIDEFEITINHEDRLDQDGKVWLEQATKIQKRAMADRVARLDRAKKEGDHDYATFGQCGLSVQLNSRRDAMLYRCWHLRDLAWCENDEGEIDFVVRKWKPYARDLIRLFPKTVSKKVREQCEKDPFAEIDVLHVVCSASHYDDPQLQRTPWVSTFIEVKECHELERIGVFNRIYVIPRWHTMSGSQYAYSPASIVALPDARLIQAMTGVLLEAGEKAVNPPMTARAEVIRSDVAIYPGGITWTDAEYDDRLGDPLKLLTNDKSGLPLGLEMQQDVRAMIREAFFLNKLTMPAPSKQMTAYEVGQRVQEWVRQSIPLFRPMEADYNGALCEATFDVLMRAGAFGSLDRIPESLQGADVRFKFKTPLREADGAQKAVALQRSRELLDMAAAVDPGSAHVVDFRNAYRAAVEGTGLEQEFIRGREDTDRLAAKQAAEQAQAKALAQGEQVGAIAKDLADANQKLGKAA